MGELDWMTHRMQYTVPMLQDAPMDSDMWRDTYFHLMWLIHMWDTYEWVCETYVSHRHVRHMSHTPVPQDASMNSAMRRQANIYVTWLICVWDTHKCSRLYPWIRIWDVPRIYLWWHIHMWDTYQCCRMHPWIRMRDVRQISMWRDLSVSETHTSAVGCSHGFGYVTCHVYIYGDIFIRETHTSAAGCTHEFGYVTWHKYMFVMWIIYVWDTHTCHRRQNVHQNVHSDM